MRGRFVVQTVSAVAVVFCHVCVIRCAAQSRGVAAQGSKRLRVWCVLFCERLCFGRPDDEVWSGEKGRQHMRLQKGRQRGGQKQRAVLSEVDRAHIRRVATGRRRRRDDAAQTQQEKQLKTSLRQGGGTPAACSRTVLITDQGRALLEEVRKGVAVLWEEGPGEGNAVRKVVGCVVRLTGGRHRESEQAAPRETPTPPHTSAAGAATAAGADGGSGCVAAGAAAAPGAPAPRGTTRPRPSRMSRPARTALAAKATKSKNPATAASAPAAQAPVVVLCVFSCDGAL